MTRKGQLCHHPELYPFNPMTGEPRPAPCEMQSCDCGKNQNCPVCGWGIGQYPCDCHKADVRQKEERDEA